MIGLCALVLAGVVAFVTRRENVDQGGKLRLRTQSTEADGGAPAMVRLFVDDRFRGVVQPEEHKDVSLPLGGHRVELRFDDGGVAARASIDVRGLTNVTMRVPPVRSDDIPAILRRARRSGERRRRPAAPVFRRSPRKSRRRRACWRRPRQGSLRKARNVR